MICDVCNGYKVIKERQTCPDCSGTGSIVSTADCSSCRGSGKVDDADCSECHGTGRVEVATSCPVTVEVDVTCEKCHGTGEIDDPVSGGHGSSSGGIGTGPAVGELWTQCPVCHGDKVVTCDTCTGSGLSNCLKCNGWGVVGGYPCEDCYTDIMTKGSWPCGHCTVAGSNQGHTNPLWPGQYPRTIHTITPSNGKMKCKTCEGKGVVPMP